jgi:peptidyl-prolyl cis-trans isomerase B (cyclophilin B)
MRNPSLFFIFCFFPILAFSQEKIPIGKIITPYGEILLSLDDRTPQHKASFIELAEAGYWDSLTINRVIPNFVAQGGCPDTEEGFNDPEYLLAPEFVPELKHTYGAVGAGRDGNPDKLSARCQFYIVQNPAGIPRLDGDYTIFGQVIKGMDIVDHMVSVKRNSKDEPVKAITMKVSIVYLDEEELKDIRN